MKILLAWMLVLSPWLAYGGDAGWGASAVKNVRIKTAYDGAREPEPQMVGLQLKLSRTLSLGDEPYELYSQMLPSAELDHLVSGIPYAQQSADIGDMPPGVEHMHVRHLISLPDLPWVFHRMAVSMSSGSLVVQ
ncbi:hypothetical protein R0381_002072 [Jeongeupia wiesaeckerbachi]|uniref:hypothetical protein n=1 Tax=Jeongeupia wiesaeckerbachi TaxID=3051218 RepID=UPI003D802B2D